METRMRKTDGWDDKTLRTQMSRVPFLLGSLNRDRSATLNNSAVVQKNQALRLSRRKKWVFPANSFISYLPWILDCSKWYSFPHITWPNYCTLPIFTVFNTLHLFCPFLWSLYRLWTKLSYLTAMFVSKHLKSLRLYISPFFRVHVPIPCNKTNKI